MQNRNNRPFEPWDNGVYGTGPIRKKKRNNLLLAFLLVLVIFLSGVVSLLSILNIRLFQQLREKNSVELPMSFAEEVEETLLKDEDAPAETVPEEVIQNDSISIDLKSCPEATPNIAQSGGISLQQIYSKNIDSVVSVICTVRNGISTGTGVIFSNQGYILTNYHVIDGASAITVRLTDERELTAIPVGSDSISDLAVLYVEGQNLREAEFGDSERLMVGDSVVAIGDPLGTNFRGTMTNGIISAINRDVDINGMTFNLIQTNAALNSGNSGGPLINCYGQVIGINTMKIGTFTDNAGVEGLGFAIPSATVKYVVDQLLSQGYVSGRPTLGIEGEELSGFYQHYYNMPAGLFITRVKTGSPAQNAGIAAGDILISIDDVSVRDASRLNAILYSHQVGDTVTVKIYRDGYLGTVELVLTEKMN